MNQKLFILILLFLFHSFFLLHHFSSQCEKELPEKEIVSLIPGNSTLAHCKNEVVARKKWAFVSFATSNDHYLLGLGALLKSFREYSEIDLEDVQFVLMAADGLVNEESMQILRDQGWEICRADVLPGRRGEFFSDDRFKTMYTKLYIFSWEQFERVVFMDADFLIIRSLQPLFTDQGELGASQGFWGGVFTRHFNAGMLSLRPSARLFDAILAAKNALPHDGGLAEQSLLNAFYKFRTYSQMPFSYNAGGALCFERGYPVWRLHEKTFDGGFRSIHYTTHKPFDPQPWEMPGRDQLLTIWKTRTEPVPPNSTAVLFFHCGTTHPPLQAAMESVLAQEDPSRIRFYFFTNAEVPVDQIWIKLTKAECSDGDPERDRANIFFRHKPIWTQFQSVYALNPIPHGRSPKLSKPLDNQLPLVWDSKDLYGGRPELLLDLWKARAAGEVASMQEAFLKHPQMKSVSF